jgi:hypothetical protein
MSARHGMTTHNEINLRMRDQNDRANGHISGLAALAQQRRPEHWTVQLQRFTQGVAAYIAVV